MTGWTMGTEAWIWMGAWALVMVLVVLLLVRDPSHEAQEDPGAILRDRFARGEITEEEFRRATALLDADPPMTATHGAHPPPPSTTTRGRRPAMTDHDPVTRRERRATGRDSVQQAASDRRTARTAARAREARNARLRKLAFGGVVVAVLAIGGALAFGDFFDRPSDGATAGAIDVQSSMAGFTPSEIKVTAGETVTLNWWTQDAAVHLTGGAHTMISPDLGLDEALPAESTRQVTWTVPNKPGTYDVWCDSCCGGKDAPQMHGKIVVEAAAADAPGQTLG